MVELPNPTPMFAGKKQGNVKPAMARVQIAPWATIVGEVDFTCAKFTITELRVIVIRNNRILLSQRIVDSNGVRFSDNAQVDATIKDLKENDTLLFSEINCVGPDRINRHLQPMEFLLTDKAD